MLHGGAKIWILSSGGYCYCFHHKKIKLISSSHRVILFLLYKFNAKSYSRDMENMSWLFSSKTLASIVYNK